MTKLHVLTYNVYVTACNVCSVQRIVYIKCAPSRADLFLLELIRTWYILVNFRFSRRRLWRWHQLSSWYVSFWRFKTKNNKTNDCENDLGEIFVISSGGLAGYRCWCLNKPAGCLSDTGNYLKDGWHNLNHFIYIFYNQFYREILCFVWNTF
jgi:hypothetical protein